MGKRENSSINVTSLVVANDMCVGCGVCAGICPQNVLSMKVQKGQYVPVVTGQCHPLCTLCLKTCPFYDHDSDLTSIAKSRFKDQLNLLNDPIIGSFQKSYVGFSKVNDHRKNGASGGMVTWLLEQLLAKDKVDFVVAVRPRTSRNKPLFEAAILNNVDEIRGASSSRYFPTELSTILRSILLEEADTRYAIVGIPCILQGVYRAMTHSKVLNRHILYLIGLACGLCPTMHYTEFLSAWSGVSPKKVNTVGYRFKDDIDVGWNYRFRAQNVKGDWSRPVGQFETFSYLWNRYYFAHNTCLFCDDVYAEIADIVFMDAWLPKFLPDTRGTSILVVRNNQINQLIEDGIAKGSCRLSDCSKEDVLYSQKSVINKKRFDLPYRIQFAQEKGYWLPRMRISPIRPSSKEDMVRINRTIHTVHVSKKLWFFFRSLPSYFLPIYLVLVDFVVGGLKYCYGTFITLVRSGCIRRLISQSLKKRQKAF